MRELGESELHPSASREEAPGGGNGSRVQTLPVAATPTKFPCSAATTITDLFALGMGDCHGAFHRVRINVGSVNLFPEHGGKILNLHLCPFNECYTRSVRSRYRRNYML